jgi:tetraacyldisaccharide 4'-kinase
MRDPAFWWREPGLASALLTPLAHSYGAIAARRMGAPGTRVQAPVICVGNFTLGGAGKTPVAIAIARMLAQAGQTPFCLSRGYGGRLGGPVQTNLKTHTAADVGDEALLLAHAAPTIVSRDRVAGARAAIAAGASTVVMDDGLQNSSIAKDLSIAVMDGSRGIGNGKVFPAGPLRAPLAAQLKRTDAVLIVGTAAATVATHGRLVLHARIEPDPAAVAAMKPRKVLAFAGIGDPERFFGTARRAGIDVVACEAFGDHHRFSGEEAAELIMQAEHNGLSLLTTEKDRARMTGDPLLAALAARAHTLPVTMVFEDEDKLRELLLAACRR